MTLESFEEAAEAVSRVTQKTKPLYSEYYSGRVDNKVCFKPENMQHTGIYKVRGAYYKISTLTGEKKARGLTTASAGNHTQGVACAARLAGIKATIVMPTITPLIEIDCTKGYGVEVVLADDVSDEACAKTYELANKLGYTFVHLLDDLAVATGQSTIAMEVIKELPTADYILIPMGGGGLCADISILARLLNPKIKVIDVEPAGVNCMQESLKTSHMVGLPDVDTIAGGTAVKCPGEKIFPYIRENVDDITTTEDSELIVALLDIVENHKMIVENSGLLIVAALKHMNVEKKKIVSVLGGGDMDVIIMASTAQHDLIQKDRVSTVSVLLPDKPDKPAKVSTLLAKEQDNVIKLGHNQFIGIDRNAAVEFRITTEAYGMEHKNAIVQALDDTGYRPKLVKSKGTYTEQDETTQGTVVVASKNT